MQNDQDRTLNQDLSTISQHNLNITSLESNETSVLDTEDAVHESQVINNRKLDADNKAHQREQELKQAFHTGVLWCLRVLILLFILMVCSLVAHWILPIKCHWLQESQLDQIKTIIASAMASKVVTDYLSKTNGK